MQRLTPRLLFKIDYVLEFFGINFRKKKKQFNLDLKTHERDWKYFNVPFR